MVCAWLWSGCASMRVSTHSGFSRFMGVDNFTNFAHGCDEKGDIVLLSPDLAGGFRWNQLILSWNADAPPGTFLDLEAAAVVGGRHTKFYKLGQWSPEGTNFVRTSVRGQGDADGNVATDTLVLKHLAEAVQIRVTLGGTDGATPVLKFIGISMSDTGTRPAGHPSDRAAWGKRIAVPERSQHGYPGERGWCSPASLSMVLAYWAAVSNRPEMNVPVPQIAAAVYDQDYAGTGNWPFNTAFAGGFDGMKSFVTRLDDLSEVEDWISAGIPVVLSVRWDLLEPGRPPDPDGHLLVCTGFTDQGNVVVNDPATRLDQGESVRRVYRRENVSRAWAKSHNTVYLIYPETARIPMAGFGHW